MCSEITFYEDYTSPNEDFEYSHPLNAKTYIPSFSARDKLYGKLLYYNIQVLRLSMLISFLKVWTQIVCLFV